MLLEHIGEQVVNVLDGIVQGMVVFNDLRVVDFLDPELLFPKA